MKPTIIFLLFFMMFTSGLVAQVCFPANGTWYQTYHSIAWGHGGEILWDETTYNSYKIAGDTIVGDSTFFKLVKNQALNYFVYEDGEKVYVGSQPDNLRLWFDYSLNPGDTFQFHAPYYSAWPYVLKLAVLSTDSILIKGIMRKHIVFSEIPGYGAGPEWIQGIGDINFGGLEMDYSYATWYANTMTLDCFTQSELSIYGVCTMDVPEPKTTCLVSPNPSDGIFRLYMHQLTYPLHIDVYDSQGMIVFSGMIQYADNSIIDLSAQTSGVYFLKIKDKKGKSKSQRILII
ncbi:MAG: T9SS type A sorting domain-containing protein [Bacteroidales bacterium]|nr:T9SS type A sorting domain-containing protein [Bacteroidales bacterium]